VKKLLLFSKAEDLISDTLSQAKSLKETASVRFAKFKDNESTQINSESVVSIDKRA
jgi:hypothetical protein